MVDLLVHLFEVLGLAGAILWVFARPKDALPPAKEPKALEPEPKKPEDEAPDADADADAEAEPPNKAF